MRGFIRTMILFLLKNDELTAYKLKKKIKEKTFDVYEPSSGVLYPVLRMLENEGLVEKKEISGKKVYTCTNKGKAYVEERMEEWKNMMFGENIKYRHYRNVMLEMKMISKIIYTMDYETFSKNVKKIVEILRKTEDQLKELW